MYKVCAYYCGTTIMLEEFDTTEEAEEFMTHDYILHYEDEMENADGDEIIYADEMFILVDATDEEDEYDGEGIPFAEAPFEAVDDWDELPF